MYADKDRDSKVTEGTEVANGMIQQNLLFHRHPRQKIVVIKERRREYYFVNALQ